MSIFISTKEQLVSGNKVISLQHTQLDGKFIPCECSDDDYGRIGYLKGDIITKLTFDELFKKYIVFKNKAQDYYNWIKEYCTNQSLYYDMNKLHSLWQLGYRKNPFDECVLCNYANLPAMQYKYKYFEGVLQFPETNVVSNNGYITHYIPEHDALPPEGFYCENASNQHDILYLYRNENLKVCISANNFVHLPVYVVSILGRLLSAIQQMKYNNFKIVMRAFPEDHVYGQFLLKFLKTMRLKNYSTDRVQIWYQLCGSFEIYCLFESYCSVVIPYAEEMYVTSMSRVNGNLHMDNSDDVITFQTDSPFSTLLSFQDSTFAVIPLGDFSSRVEQFNHDALYDRIYFSQQNESTSQNISLILNRVEQIGSSKDSYSSDASNGTEEYGNQKNKNENKNKNKNKINKNQNKNKNKNKQCKNYKNNNLNEDDHIDVKSSRIPYHKKFDNKDFNRNESKSKNINRNNDYHNKYYANNYIDSRYRRDNTIGAYFVNQPKEDPHAIRQRMIANMCAAFKTNVTAKYPLFYN